MEDKSILEELCDMVFENAQPQTESGLAHKSQSAFFSAYVLHSAGYPVTVLRICFILIASKVRNINTKAMGKAMNALGMNPAIR